MIVHPKSWNKDYGILSFPINVIEKVDVETIVEQLLKVITNLNVNHLSYSGGVDSTILLCLMTKVFDAVHTYTISSMDTHQDVLFAKKGSVLFDSIHHEFIVVPVNKETDMFKGDNAVRQLYENIVSYTDKMICGDGIDEFMCGYHKHKDLKFDTYKYFLSDLLSGHLLPLNLNSGSVKVFLPYLDDGLINKWRSIPLTTKVDGFNRKKFISKIAQYLGIPNDIIFRHKYGFIDAFGNKDKKR